jgi:hypothetical protein
MPRWLMVLGTAGLVALSALWGLSGLTAYAGAMAHDKGAMIHSAVAAAPPEIGRAAKVVMVKEGGAVETLREGTNGFTCMPDHPDSPGTDPMCADPQGWKWVMSWIKREPKPANDQPGLVYMLQGGSDISATDPWATKTDKFIESPPHYMIMWPFDPKTTGLPTTPSKTGTWIMWANTPYAHLMINQNPMPAEAGAPARP